MAQFWNPTGFRPLVQATGPTVWVARSSVKLSAATGASPQGSCGRGTVKNVAVTAGASAPEHLVNELMASLKEHGFQQLEEVELVEEDVRFSLPGELAHAASVLTTISTR